MLTLCCVLQRVQLHHCLDCCAACCNTARVLGEVLKDMLPCWLGSCVGSSFPLGGSEAISAGCYWCWRCLAWRQRGNASTAVLHVACLPFKYSHPALPCCAAGARQHKGQHTGNHRALRGHFDEQRAAGHRGDQGQPAVCQPGVLQQSALHHTVGAQGSCQQCACMLHQCCVGTWSSRG